MEKKDQRQEQKKQERVYRCSDCHQQEDPLVMYVCYDCSKDDEPAVLVCGMCAENHAGHYLCR